MAKKEKNELIYAIIVAFLSAFFTWMFSTLTESLNPVIILYTVISALVVLILFLGIEKILIMLHKKGIYWLKIYKYNKEIDQIVTKFKDLLISKEIYIAKVGELGEYLDPKIQIYKPSQASIGIYNIEALKESTLDVINEMITKGFLIYIESMKLLLLKEKMVCIVCGGEILFQDKLDSVDANCKKCSEEYRIRHDGLWHVEKNKGIRHYIGIKDFNRVGY